MALLAKEIRDRLTQYLSGGFSHEDFQEWFSGVLRSNQLPDEPEAELLASSVEWAFCDFEQRKLDSNGLRSELARLAEPVVAHLATRSAEVNLHIDHLHATLPQTRLLKEQSGSIAPDMSSSDPSVAFTYASCAC